MLGSAERTTTTAELPAGWAIFQYRGREQCFSLCKRRLYPRDGNPWETWHFTATLAQAVALAKHEGSW